MKLNAWNGYSEKGILKFVATKGNRMAIVKFNKKLEMKRGLKFLFFYLLLIMMTGCEKEIDIDLNSADPQLVIEGYIDNLQGPYQVKISETVNFSDANDFPGIENAQVIISDDSGNKDTLVYIGEGIYETTFIEGQPGRTYFLEVKIDQQVYSAISTMPEQVELDSLSFSSFAGPIGGGSSYSVTPHFKDPIELGNSYRFLLSVNNELDKTYITSNDNINNGDQNARPIFSIESEINWGDSVAVEMRCIDQPTYLYYFSLAQIVGAGPGGGTTPSNPPNNITGGEALGIFSAYTTQKIVKKVE